MPSRKTDIFNSTSMVALPEELADSPFRLPYSGSIKTGASDLHLVLTTDGGVRLRLDSLEQLYNRSRRGVVSGHVGGEDVPRRPGADTGLWEAAPEAVVKKVDGSAEL